MVSSLFENVYDDCSDRPWLQRRRTSKMSALYHESPSLLFSSMVENAVLIARRSGGDERPAVGGGAGRLRQVDVAAAQQVHAARAGVADGDRGAAPDLLLHVGVVDVHARVVQVVLHRPHRDGAGAIERRVGERRVGDDRPRRERRIGHRHDQVLVVVGVEVEPVAAAHGGAAVAEDVPREAQRAATGWCRSGSRRADRRPAPTR